MTELCPPKRMRFAFESRCRLVPLLSKGMSLRAAADACGASRAQLRRNSTHAIRLAGVRGGGSPPQPSRPLRSVLVLVFGVRFLVATTHFPTASAPIT